MDYFLGGLLRCRSRPGGGCRGDGGALPAAGASRNSTSPLSTDALWEGGHWSWSGVKYTWIHGSYIRRPTPTANWMPGYWDQDSRGWIWTDGHWQS
ncbi:MAG: YXWGXW repeat-containing protein [Alphaproteobacteria bacterium]|nr:YXWGXW repeat-containing protein [Alphaproteobacteria bacterium]